MPLLVIVVAEERPGRDCQECNPGNDRDEHLREDRADRRTDQDARALDDRGRDDDTRDDRAPWIARGEGEGEQLALVAELGEEDGAERNRHGAEELCHR